jgi:uncharacterized protein (TIGR03435 family)
MKMTGILLGIFITGGSVNAQPVLPAFEVVSVRPNHSGSPNSSSGRVAGNRYTATNVSLVSLLRVAYGIQEFQIDGQPRWADLDRFDIVAKIPDDGRSDDWPLMLQALLRDRFNLRFHREQRQAPVYVMTMAKNGHKLTAADPSKCGNPSGSCGFNGSPTRIDGTSVSMAQLAARLSRSIGVIVFDKTGLDSLFDITLEWTVEDQFTGRGASASPTIFAAIQEQLGLRLESTRGPVDVLVVDSAEKPAAD